MCATAAAKANTLQRANVSVMAPPPLPAAAPAGQHSRAISAKGTTVRGRVRQKSSKRAELLEAGELNPAPGWYNAGYIFPVGFRSRLLFRWVVVGAVGGLEAGCRR